MAMAFPGEGVEKTWRNDIKDVASFLKEYHGQSFCIWNLTDREYDFSKFDNQVKMKLLLLLLIFLIFLLFLLFLLLFLLLLLFLPLL